MTRNGIAERSGARKIAPGAILISALAACSPAIQPSEDQATAAAPAVQTVEDAGEPSLRWSGRGQEPFWTLQVNGLETEFRQPGAGYSKTADEVISETEASGRTVARFISNDVPYLIVTRSDELCLDGATGAPLPYSLEIQSGEQAFSGCGGTTEEYLAKETWVVEDVDGAGVVDGGEPRISFALDGSVIVNSICREITGAYAVNGPDLAFEFEPVDAQGCEVPALFNQEVRILDVLSFQPSLNIETGGGLALRSSQGRSLLLRR